MNWQSLVAVAFLAAKEIMAENELLERDSAKREHTDV
jgi:hypothetical protein